MRGFLCPLLLPQLLAPSSLSFAALKISCYAPLVPVHHLAIPSLVFLPISSGLPLLQTHQSLFVRSSHISNEVQLPVDHGDIVSVNVKWGQVCNMEWHAP